MYYNCPHLNITTFADLGIAMDLLSLPPDCLRLVLSKVEFGCTKEAVWAVSGSCKALQRALQECPAAVELKGKWNRRQLLGINSNPHSEVYGPFPILTTTPYLHHLADGNAASP